jgi:hypothetical protein
MAQPSPSAGTEPVTPTDRRLAVGGKYVYCIIKESAPREFGVIGIGEHRGRVYTLHHNGLAAVVSDSPLRVYDPTRENVLAHEFVNETVMREYTPIPMSFGTLFRTDEDVLELLRSTYQTFDTVLEQIRDKTEFGLKVLWDRDRVIASLAQEDAEISRLREQLERSGEGASYYTRMELGRRIEAAVEEAGARYVNAILEALRPHAVAARRNKPIGDRMIMNAAFLVDREQEQQFDDGVKAVSRDYEGVLTFKYTGPWPPYNFVNIKLKLEQATS